MPDESLPRVLCVDDEPRVVKGLALHLHNRFHVLTASNGQEALEVLKTTGKITVVISDMRMPVMDGAALLSAVRKQYPDITRVMLTGEPGRDAVVSAVNKGQIFRFLTKPCAPEELIACVEAAVDQYRLLTAERVLLQETLVGCIHALVDVLALTNPVAFGRTSRLRRQVMEFADYLGCGQGYWQLEAAAMLSQIGYLSLPAELVDKVYYGETLTADEQVLISGVPEVASKLLDHIPRLEPVVQILYALNYTTEQIIRLGNGTIGLGARILQLAMNFDSLIAQGQSPNIAVQMLERRVEWYGDKLLQQFATHLGTNQGEMQVIEMPLRQVRPGMTILQDIRTEQGTLLVARGFEATEQFLERIKTFGPGLLSGKVQVKMPKKLAAQASDKSAYG